ncbi:hypothetical protein ACWIWK_07225 [Helicobacter sp. 23-1048]
MSLKTLVMASIYEFSGRKEQALQIYKDLSNQGNVEAQLGVERLSNPPKNKTPDSKWLEVFAHINDKEQARIFKEWLGKWN